ncbi:putative Peptide-N4-(N-acetyl-beta-glucosaminyl)asparagine amidase A [Sclerotinia borealis F-4128]|uniref:Putative Peptide-N4-(N-acetyl-beta-glucosaminyl)asparagine amidase A n=1 Tax=Sclerotinia borealis (strain F-4128) TaxID=1432307 RepID=W9CIP8_SCLBF|nr:putative Peptide-N4-(N-acetyl-beta-glucosaminyl)asparagine amidase A [Sclerotinia borealis F-4128]
MFLLVVLTCGLSSIWWFLRPCSPEYVANTIPKSNLVKYSAAPAPSATPSLAVLEVFQVYQPVLIPTGVTDETASYDGVEETAIIASTNDATSCKVVLMEHSFGYSYGIPFVGNYTPPGCKFNRVVMNFTVTSSGRQFDRLALMYFGNSEVWRTSTAEPTTAGIRWEYFKDMTEYLYFWNLPQTIIFDLGNLIDSTYTGDYNTTLTATFFTSQETIEPADLILPVSARQGAEDAGSVFTLPGDNATNTISFPQNANRAVFSISACGQSAEEFWWGNVLQSNIETFEDYDGTLYGYSPFREVQVLIDGQLAGVQWPFPVVFTGGIVPGLWRPIVGLDAFDLREHEIDITPWLAILCDGSEHTFEIRVAGILDDGEGSGTLIDTVDSYWLVTGKIFIWLDSNDSVTTGTAPTISLPAPIITTSQLLTQNATGANETLTYTTNVQRSLSISSTVITENGTTTSTWTQQLSALNYGQYTAFGAIQINNATTHGVDTSTSGSATKYKSEYTYPVWVNTTYLVLSPTNFTLDATITRGLDLLISGTSVFPSGLQPFTYLPSSAPLIFGFSGTHLSTTQDGSAHYLGTSAGSTGFGSTSQVFQFSGLDINSDALDTELYYRNVEAANSSIVYDVERLVGTEIGRYADSSYRAGSAYMSMEVMSAKKAIGRGKGNPKQLLVGGSS